MIGSVQGYSTYIGQPVVDPEMIPRLENAIVNAQAFIENYIGYPLEIHENSSILDGTGNRYIFIPDFPIVEISSIKYYDEAGDEWVDYVVENPEIRYRVDNSIGQIKIINSTFFSGFQNIQVNHTSGYDFTVTAMLDFKAKSIFLALYEIATLFYDNSGLLSFKSTEAGITKSRFNFTAGSGDSQIMAMLSPELTLTLHSFAKRGVSR